jgi:hypothetical protein
MSGTRILFELLLPVKARHWLRDRQLALQRLLLS